jgi:hypothetical protein
MTTITSKKRFNDVAPENPNGTIDYAYRGHNYIIAVNERGFHVRTYDDMPGTATVISPTDARTCAEARELVEFMISTLECTRVQFYYGQVGAYRFVEIRTLEFSIT